jgi:hypothetical protein
MSDIARHPAAFSISEPGMAAEAVGACHRGVRPRTGARPRPGSRHLAGGRRISTSYPSRIVIDHFERNLRLGILAAHVGVGGGFQHHSPPVSLLSNRARSPSCVQRRSGASAGRWRHCRQARRTARPIRTAPCRRSGSSRISCAGRHSAGSRRGSGYHRLGKGRASPEPSSLLITSPATPTLPPSLRKYSTAEQTLLAT